LDILQKLDLIILNLLQINDFSLTGKEMIYYFSVLNKCLSNE